MSQLSNMMEQIRKLKNGVGVQSLLDEAYKILGNPLLIFDNEYKLLAYTEIVTDDTIWNEIVAHGTFTVETLKLFEDEGFIEDIANAPRSIFMASDKLKYSRLWGKLFNKNNSYVSNLGIMACNKPFEESDPIIFEAICKLISKEISRNAVYQEYEQTHQETIVRKLIEGDYDKKLDIAQVGIIYDSLDSHIYIAVVDISEGDPNLANTVYFRDLLKQVKPAYKYAVYSNRIIIILSTEDDVLNVNKELSELIKIFDQNNMYAGISSGFENLFQLQKYYMEAVKSLEYVVKCKCSQRIFPYNAVSINTMKQIESLENGLGIQYFLNKGFEIFGNPILFHDMEPNLLGYTENVEITDPIWQELITYGTGSDETIELFRTEGWVDIMDKTRGGALLVSDKCKYDRISWRIYNKDDIRFGCTSIVNTMRSFSEDELVLFGTFSQKFSEEVKKIELYDNIGQVYCRTVINRLLSGNIDDYTYYSEDVGNLYDNFMENLYLVVVDTTHCESEQVNLTYFRKLFSRMNAINRYAFYSKYIIIIISMNTTLLNENNELDMMNTIFEQNNIYAGISSCFDDLYQLPRYYEEAVDAVKAGMRKTGRRGKHRIFRYDKTPHVS